MDATPSSAELRPHAPLNIWPESRAALQQTAEGVEAEAWVSQALPQAVRSETSNRFRQFPRFWVVARPAFPHRMQPPVWAPSGEHRLEAHYALQQSDGWAHPSARQALEWQQQRESRSKLRPKSENVSPEAQSRAAEP